MILLLLWACAQAPVEPEDCRWAAVVAPGPLAEKRRGAGLDALQVGQIYIREARQTGDAGFYTLAAQALRCAAFRAPTAGEEREEIEGLQLHLMMMEHRFAQVEVQALARSQRGARWLDLALLGDARMEQGKLEAAAEAYQRAVELRPGLELYDRIGWLRWLWGDVEGSLEMARLAASAGSPRDPEPWAWALTRLGWLHALLGQPAPELDQALSLLPDYPPARLARGRLRLHLGAEGARADLEAAGPTVEARWALEALDPSAAVEEVRAQDRRGWALYIARQRPAEAWECLQQEWAERQDATTRMARAWVAQLAKVEGRALLPDPQSEARAALATGLVDPRVLAMGAEVLGEAALGQRALAMGPGLLPAERAALTEVMARLPSLTVGEGDPAAHNGAQVQ